VEEPIHVLLIEDNAERAQTVVQRLRQAGYRVASAPDGTTGLAMHAQDRYDIVLVGQLPSAQPGSELAEIVQLQDSLPVIALVDPGNEERAVQAIRLCSADCLLRDSAGGYLTLLPAIIERALHRRESEHSIRRQERLCRQIFERALNGYALHEIILDSAGHPIDYRFLDANPAFEELTRLKRDEIIGKTLLECLPDAETHWIETYGRVALTGEPTQFEHYSAPLDRVFEVRAYSPQHGQFVTIFSDVTEHRRVEKEKDTQRRILWTLLDSLPELVIFKDKDSIFRICNKTHAELHGMQVRDMIGKSDADIWPAAQAQEFREEELEVMRTGETKRFEHRLELPGGTRFTEITKMPLYDEHGEIVGTLCSEHDLTDRRAAEAERQRRADVEAALAQLSRALLSPATLDDIAALVIEAAVRLTGSVYAYAGHIDPQSGALVVSSMTQSALDACRFEGRQPIMSDFKGLWGWVLTHRQPLISNDPAADERAVGLPAGHFPIHRFLSVPGLLRGALVGQLSVANKDSNYTADDQELLERLATIYALALQRQRAEDSLRESEVKFRTLFNDASDAVFIHDLDFNFLEVNEVTCAQCGYTREELLSMNVIDVIAPQMRAMVQERMALLLARGEATFESVRLRKDGTEFPIEVHARMIDYQGMPVILSIGRDITERLRAERDLRRSEARFRSVFNNTNDGIFIVDAQNGDILGANAIAAARLGYTHEELLHLNIHDNLEPPEAAVRFADKLQLILRQGHGVFETEHRHRDGTPIPVEISATLLEDYDGKPAILAIIRDITERKRLEQQYIEAQRMETVGQLAGGIAHQFNNLLTGLSGYAHFAREALLPGDPARADIDQVIRISQQLADLTRRLLAYARRQVIRPRELSLNGLVLSMDEIFRQLLGPDVTYECRLAADAWTVRADPLQIEQVLINLVMNAREAMPNGGILAIETVNVTLDDEASADYHNLAPGDYIRLTVSDTGTGMDEYTLAHLYEPFFTTKGMAEATGLGLPVAHGIIRQHGGDIHAHSEPGRGSRFAIYLPRIVRT